MRRIGQFLRVVECSGLPEKRTSIWDVLSNGNECLGRIKWYGAWHQYTFHPVGNTVFSAGCLDDLAKFLNEVNQQHCRQIGRASCRERV